MYEAMDNRAVATECYKQALHCDVYSYQAFEALVQNQMLSAAEGLKINIFFLQIIHATTIFIYLLLFSERELLDSLPFAEQCKEADAELLKLLYESKLKKYHAPADNNLLVSCGALVTDRLRNNLDMQVSEAERLYYNCDYHQCFTLTEK